MASENVNCRPQYRAMVSRWQALSGAFRRSGFEANRRRFSEGLLAATGCGVEEAIGIREGIGCRRWEEPGVAGVFR